MITVVRSHRPSRMLLCAALGVCFVTCDRVTNKSVPEASPRPNIVVIVIDTLRADHVSAYGYGRPTTPNIDAWFAEGLRCDVAYSTTSYTPSSVASMLTGLYPQKHGVRMFLQLIDKNMETIPRRLKAEGYETAAFVSNVNLQSNWMGLDHHFDHYDDTLPQREAFRESFERTASFTTDAALEWLNQRPDKEKPYFLFVHYIDPHGPYAPPEPLVADFSHETPEPIDLQNVPAYQRIPGVNDGQEFIDRYDEEIAYADSHIDRLLRAVEAGAGDEETLYILTADHGETLMDHRGWFQHMYHVYEELVRVPLLLRGPGVRGGVLKDPVSAIDIAPTVYALLGLPASSPMDGVSIVQPIPDRPIFAESYVLQNTLRWHAMIHGGKKWMITNPLIEDPHSPQSRYAQVFDLQNDARETTTVLWDLAAPPADVRPLLEHLGKDPEDAAVLKSALDEYVTRLSEFDETKEQLRALGYL